MAIFLGSGFCSLVDEVVWARLIKLMLGNTVYASSVVVSTFMAGLALGALIMGRHAHRFARPLRAYVVLEILVTVSALCLPFALRIADGIYRFVFLRVSASPTGLLAVQIAVSACLLIVPTTIMGSTLPLLGRQVAAMREHVGPTVGRLYAINTLGAALGCFSAGFVLIRLLGVMGTLYLAAVVNAAVAAAAYVLSRFAPSFSTDEQGDVATQPLSARRRRLVLVSVFASGFISIAYEIVWMRSIVIPMGDVTYVFSAVLTVYLVGNQLGAWIGSRLAARVKQPAAAFGAALAALGLSGMLFLPWFVAWLGARDRIDRLWGLLFSQHGAGRLALYLFHCLVLFIVSSTVMGIGFPLALQSWHTYGRNAAHTTGAMYGHNTIGAVLGGVVAGFVLIPHLGVQDSMMLLGLAGTWIGALMVHAFLDRSSWPLRIATAGAAIAATVAVAAVPAGAFLETVLHERDYTLESIVEGPTTTVSIRSRDNHVSMGLDGIYMAGDDTHRIAQKSLGHLGALLNGRTEHVLSVGFGSGETTWCLTRHGITGIDCVEIAREVVDTALKHFGHINLGADLERFVNVKYLDAKNYLHVTDATYDVIINDSNLHATAGSAPLYTKEHFQNALRHLRPAGLFISKMHAIGQSPSTVDSILGTFLDVFPSVTIWYPATRPFIFFYLVGSAQRQTFSVRHVEQEIARSGVKESLATLNIASAQDLLTWYVGDERDIRRYVSRYTTNSDYFPCVEFNTGVPREYFSSLVDRVRKDSVFDHIDVAGLPPDEQIRWLEAFRTLYARTELPKIGQR